MANHTELKGDRCPKCNGTGSAIVQTGGLHVNAECSDCRGTGIVNSPNACKKCNGSGEVVVDTGLFKIMSACGQCNGSGLEPITD